MQCFSDLNVELNIYVAEIRNAEASDTFDPTLYKQDLDYILKIAEFMFNELDSAITKRMRALDLAKTTITSSAARLERSSLTSSRNSSLSRASCFAAMQTV